MTIRLFNTISKQIENFSPLSPNKVTMYVCGPTVYDRPHLGNARATVVYDLLFRLLRECYGPDHVEYVCNITDVDDKINDRAKEMGISIQELTCGVLEKYHHDVRAINCLSPSYEPKATEHIGEMIEIISGLINRGNAYIANNHVYFDVMSYPDYTKLTGRKLDQMRAGFRIEQDSHKKHAMDFVLWKPCDQDDDISSIFDSPWGKGRPGWHIECSAMSTKYLGKTFDIHGGGVDLLFPHHTNEIAQSCAYDPSAQYARYWIHNGFLIVNGEKMSKSLENFITVNDLLQKNNSGEVIRYALMTTHYTKPLNWTDQLLSDATKAMDSFYRVLLNEQILLDDISQDILALLKHDLNTPAILAEMHNLAKEYHKAASGTKAQYAQKLYHTGRLIGLFYSEINNWFGDKQNDSEVSGLIKQRQDARIRKDWQESDRLRVLLQSQGVVLEDHNDGTTSWHRKK